MNEKRAVKKEIEREREREREGKARRFPSMEARTQLTKQLGRRRGLIKLCEAASGRGWLPSTMVAVRTSQI
ncbi:hypothetical protein M6B38_256815 [Iris pallida]|uniref:Uncharacterized protein n=1 Tax=Iris pallida TaxID=29817 RepID=A0AAX6IGK6_IRIPA|nr:hypothetical protein M6B38_256815 [Iris pallida]